MEKVEKAERSLGELFKELSNDTGNLVKKEVELAKTEMTYKAKQLTKPVIAITIAGFLGYAGLIILLLAVVTGLVALGLDWWLACLIVGGLIVLLASGLVFAGQNMLKKQNLAPTETVQTIKEDVEWAKQQTRTE